MAFHNPPEPRALSDAELNEQVLRLQSEPDGLVRAMELIEAQAKLREEDRRARSNWELENQLKVASEEPRRDDFFPDIFSPGTVPETSSPQADEVDSQASEATQVFSPSDSEAGFPKQSNWDAPTKAEAQSEPEIDIFADLEPSPGIEPPILKTESEVFPNPIPASDGLGNSENDDFDAILFASPATEQIDNQLTPEEANQSAPQSVATSSDEVSMIVASLNASYAQLATEGEEVTVLEEVFEEAVSFTSSESTPEPLAANTVSDQAEPVSQGALADLKSPTKSVLSVVWSTLAVSSTPLVLLLAALLHDAGANFGQAIIALVAVIFVSSALTAVAAVAGKRASSNLTVVSRAAFGVWGNALPTILLLAIKLFWLAALVTIGARIITPLIFNQPWFASLATQFIFPAEFLALAIVVIALTLAAASIAGVGGITSYRSAQIATLMSIVGIGVISYFVISSLSLGSVQVRDSVSPQALVELSVFVFCLFGFLMISQGGDFSRKLNPETPGSKIFFLTFVSGFFIPTIAGVIGLVWLFASEETFAGIFLGDTLAAVAASVPIWMFVIFTVAVGISLLQLSSSGFYSVSGNLSGLGLRVPAWGSQILIALIVASGSIAVSYFVPLSRLLELMAEASVLVSVIAASWLGILVSDTLLRRYGYHEVSLTRDYGFYGRVNGANLAGFLISIGLGYGYLAPIGSLSSWSGYLGNLTPAIYDFTGSNIGILMAFGLSLLVPIVLGIPRIREQERGLLELESRRAELKEFLDTVE